MRLRVDGASVPEVEAHVLGRRSGPKGRHSIGPAVRPGINHGLKLSAQGATLVHEKVPRFQRSVFHDLNPGLTAGPMKCRPFGPLTHLRGMSDVPKPTVSCVSHSQPWNGRSGDTTIQRDRGLRRFLVNEAGGEGYFKARSFNLGRDLEWWMVGGSNPRPPHCERGALPAELTTHFSAIGSIAGPRRNYHRSPPDCQTGNLCCGAVCERRRVTQAAADRSADRVRLS